MFTKLVVGVDSGGGGITLSALGRRFRQFMLLDELHLPEPLTEDAPAKVAAFLDRHRLREARVMACLPREAVLVRFLNLPVEAETQLAKVVGYQLGSLHPYKDDQVYWDCAVVDRDAKAKQITVMVVLAEKSQVNRCKEALQELGLRLTGVTLAAAAMAVLVKPLLPPTALIVCGRSWGWNCCRSARGICAPRKRFLLNRAPAPKSGSTGNGTAPLRLCPCPTLPRSPGSSAGPCRPPSQSFSRGRRPCRLPN